MKTERSTELQLQWSNRLGEYSEVRSSESNQPFYSFANRSKFNQCKYASQELLNVEHIPPPRASLSVQVAPRAGSRVDRTQ
eukprot:2572-Hanusia_phi.AAC.1